MQDEGDRTRGNQDQLSVLTVPPADSNGIDQTPYDVYTYVDRFHCTYVLPNMQIWNGQCSRKLRPMPQTIGCNPSNLLWHSEDWSSKDFEDTVDDGFDEAD